MKNRFFSWKLCHVDHFVTFGSSYKKNLTFILKIWPFYLLKRHSFTLKNKIIDQQKSWVKIFLSKLVGKIVKGNIF